jgi:double-stranded uracil-DNA glycosylase
MPGQLRDRVRPGLRALFVGINPGMRSAALGHHFAGRSNRFWAVLHDAGLTPRRLGYEEDRLLPGLGFGVTNIASRPTRSSSDLGRRDFERGRRALREKIARLRPGCVAFVGITAWREFLGGETASRADPVRCGLQVEAIEGLPVFVLPNPSGRNAHFSYRELVARYRALAHFLKAPLRGPLEGPLKGPARPTRGRRSGRGPRPSRGRR